MYGMRVDRILVLLLTLPFLVAAQTQGPLPALNGSLGPVGNLPTNTPDFTLPIQNIQTAPTNTTTTNTSSTVCPNLSRTLSRGAKGNDVTQLQNFLINQGDLAGGNNTGFFGTLTEAAVKKFQCRSSIVCSGTPATTGYGTVGAKTRAAIARACSSAAAPTGTSYAQNTYTTYSQGSYTQAQNTTQIATYSQSSYYIQSASNQTTSNAQSNSTQQTSGSSAAAQLVSVITSGHRYDNTDPGQMYSGWGPHLGHLVRATNGDAWFADDLGNDVNVNAGVAYYKSSDGAWSLITTQAFPGRVQQNTASLISGNKIFSYGIDLDNDKVVMCYYDIVDGSKTCTPIFAANGGNYIGATVNKIGTQLVWWSRFDGTFSYAYNVAGGWYGPVTSSVAGYPGYTYVYGRLLDDNSQIEFMGSAVKAPGGASTYDAVYGSTQLGSQITNWAYLAPNFGFETWIDASNGAHFFASTAGGGVQYLYKPYGGTLQYVSEVTDMGIGARIVATKTNIYLVTAQGSGVLKYKNVPLAQTTVAINWNSYPWKTITVNSVLGQLYMYPESNMYQASISPVAGVAVTSVNYPGNVYYVQLP